MTKGRPVLIALAASGVVAAVVFYGLGLATIRAVSTARTAFADCKDCPEMVPIPAGEFTMGSPGSESFRGLEQQHRVTVPSFALGKYEVTFAQWDACVADGGCDGPAPDDQGWGKGTRPVVDVTWDEAKAYADWLSKKTGTHYRLTSEVEWEYAARAGTTTAYSFGATITTEQANFNGGSAGVNRQQTLPVGSFPANAFGLHDMHGNVWEWLEDCWHDGYADDAPANGAPYLSAECAEHVMRGGSWVDDPPELRAAARAGSSRDVQSWSGGFRVARSAE